MPDLDVTSTTHSLQRDQALENLLQTVETYFSDRFRHKSTAYQQAYGSLPKGASRGERRAAADAILIQGSRVKERNGTPPDFEFGPGNDALKRLNLVVQLAHDPAPGARDTRLGQLVAATLLFTEYMKKRGYTRDDGSLENPALRHMEQQAIAIRNGLTAKEMGQCSRLLHHGNHSLTR